MATTINVSLPIVNDYPSKADEIEFYRALVRLMPRGGYLREMFEGTEGQVAEWIRNDFTLPTIGEQMQERQRVATEIAAEVKEMTTQRDKLRADVDALQRQAERLANVIHEIKQEARRVAGL